MLTYWKFSQTCLPVGKECSHYFFFPLCAKESREGNKAKPTSRNQRNLALLCEVMALSIIFKHEVLPIKV